MTRVKNMDEARDVPQDRSVYHTSYKLKLYPILFSCVCDEMNDQTAIQTFKFIILVGSRISVICILSRKLSFYVLACALEVIL